MGRVKEAWNEERLSYQRRYYDKCKKVTEAENYGSMEHGAMLEMSWVLHAIFGLTDKEVGEVERTGFTNADLEELSVKEK